jgi:hypothetical protein
MAKPVRTQNAAQKNAEHYFRRADQQPDTPRKQRERTTNATNTAVGKDAADKLAAEDGVADPALRRERAPAVRSILRMTY